MECLKISDCEFKVCLKADEAELFSVYDMKKGRRASGIREILDYAANKYGFDVKGSRLFVEMFSVKSGDCEIFVRKSGITKRQGDIIQYIYRFDDPDALFMLLKKMLHTGHCGLRVYVNPGKEYYVASEEYITFYTEFSGKAISEEASFYLREHCLELSSETLNLLSELG